MVNWYHNLGFTWLNNDNASDDIIREAYNRLMTEACFNPSIDPDLVEQAYQRLRTAELRHAYHLQRTTPRDSSEVALSDGQSSVPSNMPPPLVPQTGSAGPSSRPSSSSGNARSTSSTKAPSGGRARNAGGKSSMLGNFLKLSKKKKKKKKNGAPDINDPAIQPVIRPGKDDTKTGPNVAKPLLADLRQLMRDAPPSLISRVAGPGTTNASIHSALSTDSNAEPWPHHVLTPDERIAAQNQRDNVREQAGQRLRSMASIRRQRTRPHPRAERLSITGPLGNPYDTPAEQHDTSNDEGEESAQRRPSFSNSEYLRQIGKKHEAEEKGQGKKR